MQGTHGGPVSEHGPSVTPFLLAGFWKMAMEEIGDVGRDRCKL
jgi:hypothetical protein